MFDPQKPKYWPLYMSLCETAAKQSTSQVAKVGALVVLPSGLISIGWNGTPAGADNCCEDLTKLKIDEVTGIERHPTNHDLVIHAEINVLNKLHAEGKTMSGGVLFTTLSPCEACCTELQNTGLKTLVFKTEYKNIEHLKILRDVGINIVKLP